MRIQAREALEALDGAKLLMNIVGIAPGSTLDLGKGMIVEAVKTVHRVPSVGYLVSHQEQRTKEQYANLPSEEKQRLGKSGVELHETVLTLQFSYSGDCTAQGWSNVFIQRKLLFF